MVSHSSPCRVRFAPSPTGFLHIGGVRTCLFNWLWARKTGGVFVLRIEDTDQERSTDASRAVILDALRWLGLSWDEGPEVGGPYGPYTQMERLSLYRAWSETLIHKGHAYRCFCTKEELDQARQALKERDPKANFRYPGTCRTRTEEPDKPFVVRLHAPREGAVQYKDLVFGEVTTPNAAQQEVVLLRADGVPLYNFGAVVDDITMGITLVARGRDHMVNTPVQILLYEAFGAPVPQFAHLPMMLSPSGEKLSKRHGTVSVSEYRAQGYAPGAVLNYLARFGWASGDREIFSKEELIDAFDWKGCGRSDGKFDSKKFLALNQSHLKSSALTPTAFFAAHTLPFLHAQGLTPSVEQLEAATPLARERAHTFVEAAEGLTWLFQEPLMLDEKAAAKHLLPPHDQRLLALAALLADTAPWTATQVEAQVTTWLTQESLTIKEVAQAARVALTGRSVSPGLFDVLAALGKDRSLQRLEHGARYAATHA